MVGPKISETLLDFAKPILDVLGRSSTLTELDQALKVAVTAWNSVIFDESVGRSDYVLRARSLLSGTPGPAALFDELVRRKRALFAGDRRLIGEVKVLEDEKGGTRVRAQAHKAPPKREDVSQCRN